MPFTLLAHQAPVLPLKLLAPRWFDGTALVVGSMVPDLVFVTHGTDLYIDAHTIGPQLWFCLPLTLAFTWLLKRRVAGPLAAHLPDAGTLHLKDFGRLAAWRVPDDVRGWLVLTVSALIGSLSHVGLDSFTHGFGWVVQHVDLLRARVFDLPPGLTGRPVHVHDLLQVGGTVIGSAVTMWCLLAIGRRRLLTDWYPQGPTLVPTSQSRRRLLAWTAAGVVAATILVALTVGVGGPQDAMLRAIDVTFAGVAVGSWRARRWMGAEG